MLSDLLQYRANSAHSDNKSESGVLLSDGGTLDDDLDSLSANREIKKVAIIAYASNSSLCGSFNTVALKSAEAVIKEYTDNGLHPEDITVFSIGKKMADAMRRKGYISPDDYTHLSDKPSYEEASALASVLVHGFMVGKYDRVELVYNHFRSNSSQPSVRECYLPLSVDSMSSASGVLSGSAESSSSGVSHTGNGLGRANLLSDYIVDPGVDAVIEELLPKVLMLKMYAVQLDTNAAEHAARTVAMQTATDNGNELLQDLTLEYNKDRQQKITSDILDIVSGSAR